MRPANSEWRIDEILFATPHSPERLALAACFVSLSFAGLVVLARSLNPIPTRTRPLNSSAPMVLWLKPWESRSLPGLPRTKQFLFTCHDQTKRRFLREAAFFCFRISSAPGTISAHSDQFHGHAFAAY